MHANIYDGSYENIAKKRRHKFERGRIDDAQNCKSLLLCVRGGKMRVCVCKCKNANAHTITVAAVKPRRKKNVEIETL